MKKLFVSMVALLATITLSAQDLTTVYNDAVAAYSAKDFAKAIPAFEQVIDLGLDSEESSAAGFVATAKKSIPTCYYMLGGGAMKAKNYDLALENFTKSAEIAELYGEVAQMNKSNVWIGKLYQVQGGEAFNAKDYATAATIFEKGYKANPRNTDMALNYAMSLCESGNYLKGMEVYEDLAALPVSKFEAVVAKAGEMMNLYTNNEVAKLQGASNFDGIITMAETMLSKNPASPLAEKIRLQAYSGKKDYAKVIELGSNAAEIQTNPHDKSLMYYTLGAAYNAREMKPQAIEAFKKVTEGPAAENAKAALVDLQK